MGYNPDLSLVDTRSFDAFRESHFKLATHLPWPELKFRLNELPARPAKLQLVADEINIQDVQQFLMEKGYEVVWCVSDLQYLAVIQNLPGLAVSGTESHVLWSPSPLIEEFLTNYVEHSFSNTTPVAIDIGCGGGRDAVYLSMNGWQVIGIDHKEAVIQRAKQLAKCHQQQIEWKNCSVNTAGCLPSQSVDLVVVIRYLNRALFDTFKTMLKPEGYVVFQTFVEGVEAFGSPKNPNYILKKGELAKTFEDFHVIVDRIDTLDDGRPVASFIAQKIK
ncbi:Ubiquinone biosynthesis O-methyltransferase [Hydrogenovibrio crunogenus]|uniref:Ubiquinone biosynthesis O-methyltransferase n=1 Tax=Hydrogenovibrio crunogenus TaxID=39765 RepID=A0A4P7NZ96_9GAMM|nr:methyltransferase domain-containing protein [Hydrogenovibrio crunogenus]QBZ83150.1 Ubiquinone biosynthesis O-methyltransferase [Hydrogenovibrio crunogenus]